METMLASTFQICSRRSTSNRGDVEAQFAAGAPAGFVK
jgi:hypothetical protein